MYRVRESWTDERLDDFRGEVNRRFDKVEDDVNRRFDKVEGDVNRRFDKVDHELNRINDRLDSMHKMLIYAVLSLGSATVAGWATMIALLLTRT